MEQKNEFILYLENITLLLLGLLFLGFPFIVVTFTTDAYVLPKQIFLGGVALLTLLTLGIRAVAEKKITIRRTSFDVPILLFTLTVLLSSLFSANRADSLLAFIPLLFVVVFYFVLTNTARGKNNVLFLVSSLLLGTCVLALSSILSFFKIYLLPFNFTHVQNFTPLGSLLDQAIYLIAVFPLAGYYVLKLLKNPKSLNTQAITMTIASIIIVMGLIVTTYQLFTTQKPLILPLETGFRTGFAAISQDTGRVLQGFLFGSGFGTYVTDFSRFKEIAFNQNQVLWSATFLRSSTALLELLATTGVLGVAAFIYLVIKILKQIKANRQSAVFLSLLLLLVALLLLPLTFAVQTLFFLVLGLFAVSSQNLFELEFQLVSFKKGVIALEEAKKTNEKSVVLPSVFLVIVLALVGWLGFLSTNYVLSDLAFQQSLLAAANNNGAQTYKGQTDAISLFRYKDVYYRAFAQTNLALANSIMAQQPKGSSPSAQTQQTVSTLIQQSITAGRTSVTLSPQTSANWQNLSSVYRGLIGFGQNAETFAVQTQQQATVLDPNNPQEYVNLGGIYYQLEQWDNAQTQFQIAINLKPDYANAYYNLGHVLLNKNDSNGALTQFETVKKLVTSDKNATAQITKEIEDLQNKNINVGNISSPKLNLNAPQTQLPEQNPPVQIPAPEASPTTVPAASPSSK